jgi:hypothetical protein
LGSRKDGHYITKIRDKDGEKSWIMGFILATGGREVSPKVSLRRTRVITQRHGKSIHSEGEA